MFFDLGKSRSLKWFADYSRNPFESEAHRIAGGGIYETPVSGEWSISSTLEYQLIRRDGFLPGSFHNTVLIGSLSRGSDFSIALTWEMSTDPYQTDDPDTFEIERAGRHWIGLDTKYRISKSHTLMVFVGQRRGGPACTSGICYEVLDFTGVELRLTSKF
jgi:hypothetical protein